MHNDQPTRTNRDQEKLIKRSKAGISPTTQAATEWKEGQRLGEALDNPGPTPAPGADDHPEQPEKQQAET